ncbi:HAMP domain-containing sensor histidine kinase [Bradyrhizobium sp. RP6]|uniref:sensor histidine kinase n=1 Tax=Bradyrhizobium sp. RP6 TaxID=2489596 RepID=UPI000F544F55|nr:HAMP domain-containing sensor histidine kinase [Bradyrhizobium sp. RP6]RQH11655.1 sensor histidine kinase [Bradyrhizobium sp. RP6]
MAFEKRNSELREQFIAVLGHDLRNPLASIQGGLRLLNKKVDAEGQGWIVHLNSSVARMAGLIDNVMDFARARLGAGVQLNLKEENLEPIIRQVISEFVNVHPGRTIVSTLEVPGTVKVDAGRIAQMVSNLLGNAISYGSNDQPITVAAKRTDAGFEISITNCGNPIPAEAMQHLFTAFHRGDVLPNQKGLGLGLYISQEIARAHGGAIVAKSSPRETTFTATFALSMQ